MQRRVAGFHGKFITGCLSNIVNKNQDCKLFSGGFIVQFIKLRPVPRAGFAPDITLGIFIQFGHYYTMKTNLKKDLFSIPAIATYIGTALSIWTTIESKTLLTFTILTFVIIILVGYLLTMHEKHLDERTKNKILEENIRNKIETTQALYQDFHQFTHNIRDYMMTAVTIPKNNHAKNELLNEFEKIVRASLTTASSTFSRITRAKCIASLMLKQNNTLRTTHYSFTAPPQRCSTPSAPLDAGSGIAGMALQTKTAVAWKNHDDNFAPIRKDYNRHYKSGLSIPFQKSFDFIGLLNIDTQQDSIDFTNEEHNNIGAAYADGLALIIEFNDMLGKHYGNS